MNKATTAIVAVVLVVIIAGGAIWLSRRNTHSSNNNTSSSTIPPSQGANTGVTQSVAATITYDGSNFSPQLTTVKSGNTVKITNNSQQEISFNSNPHPVHTDDTDLNVGTVEPGQSKTFAVTKKGSFGYHNHLDPSQTGNITIQ